MELIRNGFFLSWEVREEDSLYFRHFLKVVNNDITKIWELWIKLRQLKQNISRQIWHINI